jgi:uncharacterized membrane protein YphA (DoxX/SURF4 family)
MNTVIARCIRLIPSLGPCWYAIPLRLIVGYGFILIEIFGGLAVVIGFFIPLASVPMIVVLLVAIFTVHLPNGFSSIKLLSVTAGGAHFGQPGYETDLLYLAALIALVLGGSGPLALDRYLLRSRTGVLSATPASVSPPASHTPLRSAEAPR